MKKLKEIAKIGRNHTNYKPNYTVNELLDGINEENGHPETEWGNLEWVDRQTSEMILL